VVPSSKATVITAAQCALKGNIAHVQYQCAEQIGYAKADIVLTPAQIVQFSVESKGKPTVNSMAGSETQYVPLTIDGHKLLLGALLLIDLK